MINLPERKYNMRTWSRSCFGAKLSSRGRIHDPVHVSGANFCCFRSCFVGIQRRTFSCHGSRLGSGRFPGEFHLHLVAGRNVHEAGRNVHEVLDDLLNVGGGLVCCQLHLVLSAAAGDDNDSV